MKKITVGCSGLSGTIFAGTLLKDGKRWSSNKQDVTDMAVNSVAHHLIVKSEELHFDYEGKKYSLKVVELD